MVVWRILVVASFVAAVFAQLDEEIQGPFGHIETCDVYYVRPGDDFYIPCHTDHGKTEVFEPRIYVPNAEELAVLNQKKIDDMPEGQAVGQTIQRTRFENAQKGISDGYYTCVAYHLTEYELEFSTDTCLVIIEDVCEGKCENQYETCFASYPAGTHECKCKSEDECFDEGMSFTCSDRCEQFINPCFANVQSCIDGLDRNVMVQAGMVVDGKTYSGFCSETGYQAGLTDVTRFNDAIEEMEGTVVTLTSGLQGPKPLHVTVQWSFVSENGGGEVALEPKSDPWELTVGADTAGVYKVTLTSCRDTAVTNRVSVGVMMEDPTEEDRDDFRNIFYTCSVYPGGALDQFNGQAASYDLACTHVLAADVAPAGQADPWYIYGTFDNHDGNIALQAMTFYVGRSIFEAQRGWIISVDGEKMVLKEGEEPAKEIPGGSGCRVMFHHRHLEIWCDAFIAYYDGIMSGHIQLRDGVLDPHPMYVKKPTTFGLCNGGSSGFRPNWQVGNTAGNCKVDVDKPECEDTPLETCTALSEAAEEGMPDWMGCGGGATAGCGEIYCDGGSATPAQTCALEQAKRLNCALIQGDRTALEAAGEEEGCPTNACTWKLDVVARGCYQKNLPFHDCSFGS